MRKHKKLELTVSNKVKEAIEGKLNIILEEPDLQEDYKWDGSGIEYNPYYHWNRQKGYIIIFNAELRHMIYEEVSNMLDLYSGSVLKELEKITDILWFYDNGKMDK